MINAGSFLNAVHAGSLLNELMQRGIDLQTSFAISISYVYGQDLEPDFGQV